MEGTTETTNFPAPSPITTTACPSPVSFGDAVDSASNVEPVLEHGQDHRHRRRPVMRVLKSVVTWFRKFWKSTDEDVVIIREDTESQSMSSRLGGNSSLDDICADYSNRPPISENLGLTVIPGHSFFGDLDRMARVVDWLDSLSEDQSIADDVTTGVVNKGSADEANRSWKHQSDSLYDPSIPSPPSSLNGEGHDLILEQVMPSTLMGQTNGFSLMNDVEVSNKRRRFRLKKTRTGLGRRQQGHLSGRRGGVFSHILRRRSAQQ